MKKFYTKNLFFYSFRIYRCIKNKRGINIKIKSTNDLLLKKMMTTTRKEYILEDFIEAVTGMNLTNVRSVYP